MINSFKNLWYNNNSTTKIVFTLGKVDNITNNYIVLEYEYSLKKLRLFQNKFSEFPYPCVLKNLEIFKSSAKVRIKKENNIMTTALDTRLNGASFPTDYQSNTTLKIGDNIKFNFRTFDVVGLLFNEYAQLNIGTPILFNSENLIADYRNLLFSKMSDSEIINKVNENFKSGKYDDDLTAPLVNVFAEQWTDSIKVVEHSPYEDDFITYSKKLEVMYSTLETLPSKEKDVFINTILNVHQDELTSLSMSKPDFYEAFILFLGKINNKINTKIGSEKEVINEDEEDDDLDFMAEFEELDFLAEFENLTT